MDKMSAVEMTDEIALSWNGSTDKSFWKENHLLIKMVKFLEMMEHASEGINLSYRNGMVPWICH